MRALLEKVPDSVQVPDYLESSVSGEQGGPCVPHDRRRFARRKMGGDFLYQCISPLPAFPRGNGLSKVLALDVSRSGISFLADMQLYPDEEVLLWTFIGRIPCKVARCLKHNDHCYEIGAEIHK